MTPQPAPVRPLSFATMLVRSQQRNAARELAQALSRPQASPAWRVPAVPAGTAA